VANGAGDILCKSTVTNMAAVRKFASVKKKDIICNKFNAVCTNVTDDTNIMMMMMMMIKLFIE